MRDYDGSWHGGKGSRPRNTDINKVYNNWDKIFKKLSRLDRMKVIEAWHSKS